MCETGLADIFEKYTLNSTIISDYYVTVCLYKVWDVQSLKPLVDETSSIAFDYSILNEVYLWNIFDMKKILLLMMLNMGILAQVATLHRVSILQKQYNLIFE